MHLVQRFSKVLIPLWKNCCSWSSSQPFAVQITFSLSETLFFHEFFQFRKQTEATWSQDNAPDHTSAQALAAIQNAGFELLRHPHYSLFIFVLHGKWQPGRPTTTILLQRNQSFGEMLDQVHFSCRKILPCAYLLVNCVGLRTF